MRPLQLVIAALFGACLVVLVLLVSTRHECEVPPGPPAIARPVRVIDTGCWSCGSGSGPSADELTSMVGLADDEIVVALDEQPTDPTHRPALPDLIDTRDGRQRFHSQFMDLEIQSPRGQRRVLILLH